MSGAAPGYIFPKNYADVAARLRVSCGFVLVAAFAWFSQPTAAALIAGIPISVVGILLRAWAAGHLAKNRRLATSGPYAYVRNPLYIGTLLVAAGLVVASRSWLLAVLFAAVFGLVYLPVIELEEQHLRKLFPEYAEYAERVGRFWPRQAGPGSRAGTSFALAQYRLNREYQAAVGFLAGVAFLIWKAMR